MFSRPGGHKTKETYPTRPGSPTPCKQALSYKFFGGNVVSVPVDFFLFLLTLISTLVAASISNFLTVAVKFSCYSSNEIGLHCFKSRSSYLSVIHVNVDIKIKSKERIGFVVVVVVVLIYL